MQINGPTQVHGPQTIAGPHRISPRTASGPATNADIVDQLDISAEADFVSRAKELPDVRADKVADIKARIADGSYFTDDKLDAALDRLLDEIS